ncbi:MAG TPA: agmatinase family protein, partial [Patescibacteria group bacterium]|nr:agmatinase family protein [Patescibacteria group bacterium]
MNGPMNFLGLDHDKAGRDRICVVPVPLEWSTSYRSGTAMAPEAIIEASCQIELYNAPLDLDLEHAGIVTLQPGVTSRDDLVSFIRSRRKTLLDSFTCFIGGEHSITPWILEELACGEIGLVWLDAHADLRASYRGERESHACAARNALRFGPIVEVGVRSFSREEHEFLSRDDRVQVFGTWSPGARDAIGHLPDRIYLSLDFDCMDPSILRAVGTPEPDGLTWRELMDLLTFLFDEKTVVAMDAVELCPVPDDETSNFIAAKIIYEAVSRFL